MKIVPEIISWIYGVSTLNLVFKNTQNFELLALRQVLKWQHRRKSRAARQ